MAKPQALGRRDGRRRRRRLALPGEDVEHDVGAAGAAVERFGAGRLDRLRRAPRRLRRAPRRLRRSSSVMIMTAMTVTPPIMDALTPTLSLSPPTMPDAITVTLTTVSVVPVVHKPDRRAVPGARRLGASLRDRATLPSPLRDLDPSGGYPSRLRPLRSLRAPLARRLADAHRRVPVPHFGAVDLDAAGLAVPTARGGLGFHTPRIGDALPAGARHRVHWRK